MMRRVHDAVARPAFDSIRGLRDVAGRRYRTSVRRTPIVEALEDRAMMSYIYSNDVVGSYATRAVWDYKYSLAYPPLHFDDISSAVEHNGPTYGNGGSYGAGSHSVNYGSDFHFTNVGYEYSVYSRSIAAIVPIPSAVDSQFSVDDRMDVSAVAKIFPESTKEKVGDPVLVVVEMTRTGTADLSAGGLTDSGSFEARIGDSILIRALTSVKVNGDKNTSLSVENYGRIAMHTAPIPVKHELTINSLSQKTFVATDQITLRASIGIPRAGVTVTWTVVGQGAASGVGGFETDFATTTDATGTATYTFTPSRNAVLVNDRRTKWTLGSRTANPAIGFDVTAKAVVDGEALSTTLSGSGLGPLLQDETDTLREEYFDYGIPVPNRSDVASLGGGFNQGNYGVQLSVDLPGHYNSILAAYRRRAVTVSYGGRDYAATVPDNATLTIKSGYRNPQRNKAIGSVVPDSNHTRGRALDLVPNAVQVLISVSGRPVRVTLPLHGANGLYAALYAAGQQVGTSIAEQSAIPVPLGDARENHIHVQWRSE